MEHIAPSEANSRAVSQDILRLLWNLNVNYYVYQKRPPPVPFLSQMNPVLNPIPNFPKIILMLSSHILKLTVFAQLQKLSARVLISDLSLHVSDSWAHLQENHLPPRAVSLAQRDAPIKCYPRIYNQVFRFVTSLQACIQPTFFTHFSCPPCVQHTPSLSLSLI